MWGWVKKDLGVVGRYGLWEIVGVRQLSKIGRHNFKIDFKPHV